MNKKVAISIIVGLVALAYLFLFVGLPMLKGIIVAVPDASGNVVEAIPAPLVDIVAESGCADCGYSEAIPVPAFLYYLPGLIGLLFILMIIYARQKKEGKKDG